MTTDAQQADLTVMESSGVSLMARIRYPNGSLATVAETTSVTRRVAAEGTTSVTNVTQVVSNTVFDVLQTPTLDPRWTRDAMGYNVKLDIDDDIFGDGDKIYDVFMIIEPTAMARVVTPPFSVHSRDLPGE